MTIKLTPTYHRDTYPAISPTNPSLSQAGKTILITGGGGGIGFEIARSFAIAAASRVIIVGRRAGFLDEAVANLGDEFHSRTEFIAHQTDIASDTSVASLWEFLGSQNILVDVLVLNAACIQSFAPDTLSVPKVELMKSFDTNVGGNFLMAVNFTKQALRPAGLPLYLVNVSTSSIHTPTPSLASYSTSKAAFTMLLGQIADERPVEDLQIVSFHPGVLYSESAARAVGPDAFYWDEFALPADFSVWAASPEASWLHGRFVWAHWDIEELKADREVVRRLEQEDGYLKVGVEGLFDCGQRWQ